MEEVEQRCEKLIFIRIIKFIIIFFCALISIVYVYYSVNFYTISVIFIIHCYYMYIYIKNINFCQFTLVVIHKKLRGKKIEDRITKW